MKQSSIQTRQELIKLYLDFYKSKSHKIIPSASLIPENDPTVLFTTAGMHPLVPFLLGQKHPLGKRIANVQKCIRTQDIEEVGDSIHNTFFEMLGNWSLGDYWKKEAIKFTFEFHTKVLGIPIEKYAVSVFKGDKDAPKDEESAKIWKSLGIKEDKIAYLEKSDNWWGPAGEFGPCGPDTEQFYWTNNKINPPKKFDPKDKNWVEIGNDVLMEYNKTKKGYEKATQKNVDFGGGVERTLAVLNGLDDIYQTSIFLPIIKEIEKISSKKYTDEKNKKAIRIIADHTKAAAFILGDARAIKPSNVGQGYVLRRLIRRAVRYGKLLGIKTNFIAKIAESVLPIYSDYQELKQNKQFIISELNLEEERFNLTLEKGLKLIEKLFNEKKPIIKEKFEELMKNPNKRLLIGRLLENKRNSKPYSLKEPNLKGSEIDNAIISGTDAFLLFQSYGFPLELTDELAMTKGLLVDHHAFREEFEKHQELSRTSSSGMFKSGLADNSEIVKKLHTATHMLNEVLRIILKDNNIKQKGSNITPERLRFDFNFPRKLTDEEIKKIEELMNKKIKENLKVVREEIPFNQAIKSGAQGEFGMKYPEMVSVYTIEDKKDKKGFFSKEICTGPHVSNTKEIGHFKIIKEESVAAGIRRIKAVVN
ncbi:MAG: alanine--tRNA ligase-related protein [Nanoarchaeota archaeon]